ncbi:MAG: DNA-directed RNA polymerase subunit K [Candidatus Thorarchaeota archaeon]|nr:MAG: DNA-directed RNA polymerase subunit K [Candidatus Thorarchaeota archaeon]
MSKGSKKDKKEKKELTEEQRKRLLTYVPGVGPKTAEKLTEAGYGELDNLSAADPEALAEAVTGLSVSKAEGVISEAVDLKKLVDEGKFDPTSPRRRRRRAPEPDPDVHELPPAQEVKAPEEITSIETGLEVDNKEMGIPAGPKWLTRFERARIVGARALQISMGAPVLVDMNTAPKEVFALAEAELKNGVLPMTVRRSLPTGETFDIPLKVLLENTRLD